MVRTAKIKRFPGQYYDVESQTHYNFNRDYNPKIGKYIQSDPIGLSRGENTYLYAMNNPSNMTDTTGLFKDGGGCPVNRGTLHYTWQVTVAEILEAKGDEVTLEARLDRPYGVRCVDVLADSSSWYDFFHKYWAIEIKVGYTSLSTFVRDQLIKDNYLYLNNNEVERVSWH